MAKNFLLLSLAFLILLSLRLTAAPNAFDEKFNSLERNMTPTQVKTLLGPPDLREVKDDQELWHYAVNNGRRLIFKNGKLTEFGMDVPAQAPTPTPTPPPHDLTIGSSCKNDKECKSDNCHFGTCSGSTNCSATLGHICATDADCCEGRCDFQFCRKK